MAYICNRCRESYEGLEYHNAIQALRWHMVFCSKKPEGVKGGILMMETEDGVRLYGNPQPEVD